MLLLNVEVERAVLTLAVDPLRHRAVRVDKATRAADERERVRIGLGGSLNGEALQDERADVGDVEVRRALERNRRRRHDDALATALADLMIGLGVEHLQVRDHRRAKLDLIFSSRASAAAEPATLLTSSGEPAEVAMLSGTL